MMISAFARESGLPVDTVRLYVRRGLLHPETGRKGGSRPYQIFSRADVHTAYVIRIAQAQGLSLAEIGAFLAGKSADEVDDAKLLAYLADQRTRLTRKAADLQKLIGYIDAKAAWIKNGKRGPKPPFPV
jgi:MerR family transcriptional regulator, copper efflux regulator